jgi:hypothetical protein
MSFGKDLQSKVLLAKREQAIQWSVMSLGVIKWSAERQAIV